MRRMKRLRAKSRNDITSMERTSITRSYEIIVAQVAGDSASTGPVTGAARSLDRVLLEAVSCAVAYIKTQVPIHPMLR